MDNGRVIGVLVENTTTENKNVGILSNYIGKQEGVIYSSLLKEELYDFVLKEISVNTHLSDRLRLQYIVIGQIENPLILISRDCFGSSSKIPFFPINYIHKFQFQKGVIDISFNFVINNEIEFNTIILPNSSLSMSLFVPIKTNKDSFFHHYPNSDFQKVTNSFPMWVENKTDGVKDIKIDFKYKKGEGQESIYSDPDSGITFVFGVDSTYVEYIQQATYQNSRIDFNRVYISSPDTKNVSDQKNNPILFINGDLQSELKLTDEVMANSHGLPIGDINESIIFNGGENLIKFKLQPHTKIALFCNFVKKEKIQVIDIEMPSMGERVKEAKIIKWLKKEGESVKVDEVICEIATDKVDTEIISTVDGVIETIFYTDGEMVNVGELVASIISKPRGDDFKMAE